ncbi:SGNH/GDSL hydrolase family protein [bacterium]|nr:SGNH/GDSL hydrolase family protein [bacterium]
MPRKTLTYPKKILLALASLVFTLLALETYLRIFPDHDFQTNNPYQYTRKIGKSAFQQPFHSMKELYPLQFDNRHYYEKSGGMIHYNFDQFGARWLQSKSRDSSGFNVFVLGDSFTLGFGLRYEDSYIYKLQDQLRKQQIPVNFWNFAAPGAESRKCLSIYKKCSQLFEHELILYGLHLNDLLEFPTSHVISLNVSKKWWFIAERSKLVYFLAKKKSAYFDRKRRIKKLLSPAVFQTPYFRSNLQAILDLEKEANSHGKHLRIVLLPILVDVRKDSFRPVYKAIMAELTTRGVQYYDLTHIPREPDHAYWILPFDQHPNEKANAIFANQLTSLLLQDAAVKEALSL